MKLSEPHLAAWRAVLNAHASVTCRVEAALAEADLPPLSWYDVLWAVRSLPDRRARMSELADRLTVSRGGMTKLVDRLERAGLLRREACAEDRRGFHAAVTPEGEQMLRRMWSVYSLALQEAFVDRLSADDAEQLADGLARLDPSSNTVPA